jgi:hypothetical protein
METPSPYGHDEHMEKYRADREAREQVELDRLAAALGKNWNPVRPADVRAWNVVPAPKFKKDYPGQFVRVLDVPRHQYGGNAHDAVPDNAVMQIHARNTGMGSGNEIILNCDWHCPCCGHAHQKEIKETAIAEGKLQFLSPGDDHAADAAAQLIVYLAAPYTHPHPAVRQERWLDASRAAAWLMQCGHSVISPISMGHPICVHGAEGDWAAWQCTCLAMLEAAQDMVILDIDGWRDSNGIRAEATRARRLGMPLWLLTPTNVGSFSIRAMQEQRWW